MIKKTLKNLQQTPNIKFSVIPGNTLSYINYVKFFFQFVMIKVGKIYGNRLNKLRGFWLTQLLLDLHKIELISRHLNNQTKRIFKTNENDWQVWTRFHKICYIDQLSSPNETRTGVYEECTSHPFLSFNTSRKWFNEVIDREKVMFVEQGYELVHQTCWLMKGLNDFYRVQEFIIRHSEEGDFILIDSFFTSTRRSRSLVLFAYQQTPKYALIVWSYVKHWWHFMILTRK